MSGGAFSEARAKGWTAVALPYRGRRLSMIAALPPAAGRGCQLPSASTVGSLAARLARSKARTDIALPKVKLAASESLKNVLREARHGIAFGDNANLHGTLSPQACCIGFVQHAATLAVDERARPARRLAVDAWLPTAAHVTLSFDRPYLLILRDSRTGRAADAGMGCQSG